MPHTLEIVEPLNAQERQVALKAFESELGVQLDKNTPKKGAENKLNRVLRGDP